MLFGFHLRHVRRVTSRITSRTATRITTRPGSQPIGHKHLHERDLATDRAEGPMCSFSTGDRTLCDPRFGGRRSHSQAADSRRASDTQVVPGSRGPRLDPRRCSARTFEQHGADVQNAKKSEKSSHRFAISEACVGVGAVTAIVIVIREACGVETGVRRDRAIDGRLAVQGNSRVEVECAGRPPRDGPVEVRSLARSRPEPLLRTWRSGSARR